MIAQTSLVKISTSIGLLISIFIALEFVFFKLGEDFELSNTFLYIISIAVPLLFVILIVFITLFVELQYKRTFTILSIIRIVIFIIACGFAFFVYTLTKTKWF